MKLNLDFSLNGAEKRCEFINKYLDNYQDFLTEDNLEMIANYLLWGSEQDDPELDFQIESRNRTPWQGKKATLSLESLIEAEAQGVPLSAMLADAQLQERNAKLSRVKVIRAMGEEHGMQGAWLDIWKKIDETEFKVQTWEAANGKRRVGLEIREGLIARLYVQWLRKAFRRVGLDGVEGVEGVEETGASPPVGEKGDSKLDFICGKDVDIPRAKNYLSRCESSTFDSALLEILAAFEECPPKRETLKDADFISYLDSLAAEVEDIDGYSALKMKRALVSLRTQQYPMLDNIIISPCMNTANFATYYYEEDCSIKKFLPLMDTKMIIDKIEDYCFEPNFQERAVRALKESDANAKQREEAQKKADGRNKRSSYVIDMRNSDDVRYLLYYADDMRDKVNEYKPADKEIVVNLIKFLDFYVKQCNFSPILSFILQKKIAKYRNKQIADMIREKFNVSYQENYISTIWRKQIINAIAEQADKHYHLIEYILMGKTVFKRCSKCGELKPRNEVYYNKKTSSSDGFLNFCKVCKLGGKT